MKIIALYPHVVTEKILTPYKKAGQSTSVVAVRTLTIWLPFPTKEINE